MRATSNKDHYVISPMVAMRLHSIFFVPKVPTSREREW